MALVVAEPACALAELKIGDSPESLARLVESQRVLFHSQIDQLQKLVVAQCKLTGANPLAQEMAAGALSIRIGKRPRDLLNPKAIKYMQSIFSIKDTIGKKETREISALCGVTISQVREFFAGQRSRVRKLARLSCENATKSDAYKTTKADSSFNLDQPLPLSVVPSGNAASAFVIGQQKQVSDATGIVGTVKIEHQMMLSSVEILKVVEGHPLLSQEETDPGVDSDDKEFLDKIFNMMKKEQTFAGQVRLMEWILRVQNNAILNWFSNNGGSSILATWLSQAADEEQTTVLLFILKVLYHLPLHKALPLHMSIIVSAVNRLRFYRTSDISNKARILLSRWSKVFIKGQALKRPHIASSKATLQKTILNKRICGFLDGHLVQSSLDTPENILALTGEVEITREPESKQARKLLTATCTDTSKKHDPGVTVPRSKERRKVLLVEQLDHKVSGRSSHVVRKVASNHSRPMSADDIQKAKMRAMFMRHKYGKANPSSSRIKSQKIKDLKPAAASLKNNLATECTLPQASHVVEEETSMSTVSTEDDLSNKIKSSISNPNSAPKQDRYGILSCKPILWSIPQEISINSTWSVGTGQNSKEFDVQIQRNRRESETLYSCLEDTPNPKEPWDIELDFDDSLTPEIPTEQPSDAEVEDDTSCPNPEGVEASASLVAPEITISAPSTSGAVPEPDLELLAVLLKNPDLVFALTSNQGKPLSNGEMVALLDMLKKNGVGLMTLLNEMASQKENGSSNDIKFGGLPTSLPSPTPPSEAERISAWRSELPTFSTAPLLLPHFLGNRAVKRQQIAASSQHHLLVAVSPMVVRPPAQPSVTMFSTPLVTVVDNSVNQSANCESSLLKRLPPSPPHNPSYTNQLQQTKVFDVDLPSKHYPVTNSAFISSVHRQESFVLTPPAISAHLTLPTRDVQRTGTPFSCTAPAWRPVACTPATPVERDLASDHLIGRGNSTVEISTPSQRELPSQITYDPLPNGSSLPLHYSRREDENSFSDQLHNWRSDNSPARRATEFSSGWGYDDESRRDGRLSKRSRQWDPVSWDRDRNRDRDRDGSGTGKRWQDYSHGRRR